MFGSALEPAREDSKTKSGRALILRMARKYSNGKLSLPV